MLMTIIMDNVVLKKAGVNKKKSLEEAIRLLGGFGTLREPIIIKPNICTDNNDTGATTTDVKMMDALLKLIIKQKQDIAIRIVESDSESKFIDDAFEKLGYRNLEERYREEGYDIRLINLTREPLATIDFDGLYFKNLKLPKLLTEHGYFVSMAIPKTHSLTLMTGVIKNLFGLIPIKGQSLYHPNINEVIVDLNRILQPDLCIVDALLGQEGVLSGKTKRINRIIVGRKPLSVDAVTAAVMGFEANRIRHFVEAEKYALGTFDPEIIGESLESSVVKFNPLSNLKSTAFI